MLVPTILSINWFFSFILLRRLEESKETRKLLFFKQNGSTNFSLFFDRKTRGSGFWTILICFVAKKRIRGKAFRNESLETNNAKDSIRVMRMFVEVDVVSAFLSSTTQDTSQKGRSIKRIHTVNPFCFVIYCSYRLINHFEECSS